MARKYGKIGLSQARRAGAKVPRKRKSSRRKK